MFRISFNFMGKNMLAVSNKIKTNSKHTIHRTSIVLHADPGFIGSQANLAILLSTTVFLVAGRIGLAPSANRPATAGLKLQTRDSGLKTGDPAGFTVVDTLAFGAMGHIVGVGIYLGTVGSNLQ